MFLKGLFDPVKNPGFIRFWVRDVSYMFKFNNVKKWYISKNHNFFSC